mmetsp:Transcript_12041/g.39605  ORF Transcript_12041/g.39605 Transcript_12041/m.39605 type:complete len:358 (-) Transcript_12041:1696-2769(-)
MGCAQSVSAPEQREAKARARRGTQFNGNKVDSDADKNRMIEPLTSAPRVISPLPPEDGKVSLTYSVWSYPGAEPGKPMKENQDSFVHIDMHELNTLFFGVFDGHGMNGHHASRFLVDKFEQRLRQIAESEKGKQAGKKGDYGSELKTLAREINGQLLKQKFDLSTSGSTGTMLALTGDHLTMGNVGDSRICWGVREKEGGEIQVDELTHDHKPDLPSEMRRIQACGGRVHPLVIDGESVGPPRVWMRDEDAPGLCMSRSFGDELGASVGVTADPDVTYRRIPSEPGTEVAIVIGSDGIYEFSSNEDIINMVYASSSPSQACQSIVHKARTLWREEEGDIIDDCTVIVILIKREGASD